MNVYAELRDALRQAIQQHHFADQPVRIWCKVLSAKEAIGTPEHDDYPLIKGKEVMVEAVFDGIRGHAFTDEFEHATYLVEDLVNLDLNSNKRRASFIAGLNAIFRCLGLCEKTIHCKDTEPQECARHLLERIAPGTKVLLVGFQPRFLDVLAINGPLRVVDRNPENIGKVIHDVTVEPPQMTNDAITWCDLIFASGSTVVNGTLPQFLNRGKPVIFYGVTIAATAMILNIPRYCHCGH
jgi:uncharacterized protein (DUF4213/DUF364 family)